MSGLDTSVVVGMGEVGKAHYNVLKSAYESTTAGFDVKGKWPDPVMDVIYAEPQILHICIPFLPNFDDVVVEYIKRWNPEIVNICTTVTPGTSRRIAEKSGVLVCHSTTRGLHPNLEDGLRTIRKHIGGPKAAKLAQYFWDAGIPCVGHNRAETTEVAHLLMNLEYAVNLAFADESARVCRLYGVDFMEAVLAYKETYNEGFERLDHGSKRRMLLTPPNGRIGGHCLVQNAEMLYPELEAAGVQAPLIKIIKDYNTR